MNFNQHLVSSNNFLRAVYWGFKLWTALGKCADPVNGTQNTLSIMLELSQFAQTGESDCLNDSIEQSSPQRYDHAAIGDEK